MGYRVCTTRALATLVALACVTSIAHAQAQEPSDAEQSALEARLREIDAQLRAAREDDPTLVCERASVHRRLGRDDGDDHLDLSFAIEDLGRPTDRARRRVLGACLYEMGRREEGQNEPGLARAYYERSLSVRPNDIVRARLATLPPAPETFILEPQHANAITIPSDLRVDASLSPRAYVRRTGARPLEALVFAEPSYDLRIAVRTAAGWRWGRLAGDFTCLDYGDGCSSEVYVVDEGPRAPMLGLRVLHDSRTVYDGDPVWSSEKLVGFVWVSPEGRVASYRAHVGRDTNDGDFMTVDATAEGLVVRCLNEACAHRGFVPPARALRALGTHPWAELERGRR